MVNQEPVIEHRGGPGAAGADPVRDYILGGLAEGRLKPHVSQTFPLEKAAEALKSMAARQVKGKVVLTVG